MQRKLAKIRISRGPAMALGLGGAILAALSVFAYFAGAHDRFPGDPGVSSWVQSWRSSGLDTAMEAISRMGGVLGATPVVVVVAAALILVRWRREALFTFASAVGGLAMGALVKAAVGRPRPGDDLVQVLQDVNGQSFPSATVTLYTAFLGTLIVVVSTKMPPGLRRTLAQAGLVLLLAAIGYSRIYMGAHWLSDVVGGYAFGGAVALTVFLARRWWFDRACPELAEGLTTNGNEQVRSS